MELIERMLNGDKRALSRLMSLVETNDQYAAKIIREIYSYTGNAHVIGITGAPGIGKSTLVDRISAEYRKLGKSVGILAVDPTSPFTGGSILGDRIRMNSCIGDEGLFIRSIATRGSLGGLSRATGDFVKLLDAFGKDVILIETVGTGQSEVEIVSLAQTTMVVLAPGYGDEVQTIKAGIMEIGDLFIVNKADHPETSRTVHEIEAMLHFKNLNKDQWNPTVLTSIASQNKGVSEIVNQLVNHQKYLIQSGTENKKNMNRIEKEMLQLIKYRFEKEVITNMKCSTVFERTIEDIKSYKIDPHTAVDRLFSTINYLGEKNETKKIF
ncbi:methylmalonyl Co-A mutase-associated GTPase MeaB [Anaerobacillus sp. MEB173]|uniref:methylmalonyl Co-A mutase-associated GTPase MeaB n=1 Tax=Anaerobacillus sp. MEB173 TaxID=3383345 RepID=UPI003F8E5625